MWVGRRRRERGCYRSIGSRRFEIDAPNRCCRDCRQIVLERFGEGLIRDVDVEIVVPAARIVTGKLVVMVRAVGEMDGRGRLLAVEAVVHVAMCVRERSEQPRGTGQPCPTFRDHHTPRIASRERTGYPGRPIP